MVMNGHDVDIYAGDFNYRAKKRTEYRDGVRYLITPSLITSRIFGNPSDPLTAFYRCFQPIHGHYDVYHLFQPFLQAFLPWYFLKLKKNGLFLYDWDDLWTGGLFGNPISLKDRFTQAIVRKLEAQLPSYAKFTTVCSTYLQEKAGNTAEIIYNGFWPKLDLPTKSQLRSKWSLDNNIFYIAYIGKTAAELYWIEKAILLLDKQNIEYRLILAGPPASFVNTLKLGSNPSVIYFGEVSSIDAAELAKASDLGLLPLDNNLFNQSRFPIKFFDFLSVGTPVYYSKVGDIQFIGNEIESAISGAVNAEEWASQLGNTIQLIQKKFPESSIHQLEAKYSWSSIAKSLLELYKANEK